MAITEYTIKHITFSSWVSNQLANDQKQAKSSLPRRPDLLNPLRKRLDSIKIDNPQVAHRLCQLIPSQCPFARKIQFRNRTLITIPPLCKINPLYEEVMALRFRAICYLADECGEDISRYC